MEEKREYIINDSLQNVPNDRLRFNKYIYIPKSSQLLKKNYKSELQ